MIILGARFIPIDAPGLHATIWKPLVKCGQQSLEVFAVGIYLAFIGYWVLNTTSDGVIAQLLVGTAGIAIMTAVAYYRSWSKRVEKTAHAHVGVPQIDKSHPTDGELPRPAERVVVGVVAERSVEAAGGADRSPPEGVRRPLSKMSLSL